MTLWRCSVEAEHQGLCGSLSLSPLPLDKTGIISGMGQMCSSPFCFNWSIWFCLTACIYFDSEKSAGNDGKRYTRLARTCPFCDSTQKRLSRHIREVHRNEPCVSHIVKLPRPMQRKEFAVLRNRGIVKANKKKSSQEDMEKIKKSMDNVDTVHCSFCNGAYTRKYFYRHKLVCNRQEASPVLASTLKYGDSSDPEFLKVMSRLHSDEVGRIAREDETIRMIGWQLFLKGRCKVDKLQETKRNVRADMRLCATLLRAFKKHGGTGEARNMFDIDQWQQLHAAIDDITIEDLDDEEKRLKYGLKNSIYHALMKYSDIIKGKALTVSDDSVRDKAVKAQDNFQGLLKHNEPLVFSDSKYLLNKSRQERLRLPSRTPDEAACKQLREYTVNRIAELTASQDLDQKDFIELRNLTCSRLTLFNARRGGEPCRMTLDHWLDRRKWRHQKDELFFKDMELTYVTGKGNHLVSVIFPKDTIKPMDILTDTCVREKAMILPSNKFIFASSTSNDHMGGWESTCKIVQQSGVDGTSINATNNRGRISTIYASLDVPKRERELFFKHMGHGPDVNEGIYQRPLPVLAVQTVGKTLANIGKPAFLHKSNSSEKYALNVFLLYTNNKFLTY